MKRSTALQTVLLLSLSLLLAGCGLFGGAAREREQANEAITEGVRLGRVVTAEGIGDENAPIEETDTFDASQDYIYVVAEADYIEEGTSLFARWSREGEPFEDSSEITADRDYEDTYIEFHLQNMQSQMEEGDYSVQIFANGNPVEEIEFTVN
jgi:predicted small secreted protein